MAGETEAAGKTPPSTLKGPPRAPEQCGGNSLKVQGHRLGQKAALGAGRETLGAEQGRVDTARSWEGGHRPEEESVKVGSF